MVSVLVIVKKHKWSVQQNLLATGISNYWFLEVVFTKSIWGAALNINWNFCIIEANYDHLHVTRALSNNLRASKMAKKFKKITWRVGWQMTNKLVFAPIPECPAKHLLSTPIKSLHWHSFFCHYLGMDGIGFEHPFSLQTQISNFDFWVWGHILSLTKSYWLWDVRTHSQFDESFKRVLTHSKFESNPWEWEWEHALSLRTNSEATLCKANSEAILCRANFEATFCRSRARANFGNIYGGKRDPHIPLPSIPPITPQKQQWQCSWWQQRPDHDTIIRTNLSV